MALLRFVLVVAVLGYAGWLAWPLISPLIGGAPEAAGLAAASGGWTQPALWVAAAALYAFSALLLGANDPKAAVAYFLGFVADAVLRLALGGGAPFAGPGDDIAARSIEAVPVQAAVNPTWIVLGVLAVIGLLVAIASQRRRRRRVPGQFAT